MRIIKKIWIKIVTNVCQSANKKKEEFQIQVCVYKKWKIV